MQNNTPSPITPKHIFAGLSGAAIFAVLQRLGQVLAPLLAAFLSSMSDGGTTIHYVECGNQIPGDNSGNVSGDNNSGNNVVFCDAVNQFIDDSLLIDLEVSQTLDWDQITENILNLDVESSTTFASTSVVYKLAQISNLIETSTEPLAPCYLPHAKPRPNRSTWQFDTAAVKKNLWN